MLVYAIKGEGPPDKGIVSSFFLDTGDLDLDETVVYSFLGVALIVIEL